MLHEFLQSEAGRNGNISSPSPSINAVSNPPSTIPSPQLVAQIEGATRRISAQDPSRWKKIAQTDSVFLSLQGRTGTTSQQPGTSGSRGPLSQREANLMNQKEADDAFFAQFMLDKWIWMVISFGGALVSRFIYSCIEYDQGFGPLQCKVWQSIGFHLCVSVVCFGSIVSAMEPGIGLHLAHHLLRNVGTEQIQNEVTISHLTSWYKYYIQPSNILLWNI